MRWNHLSTTLFISVSYYSVCIYGYFLLIHHVTVEKISTLICLSFLLFHHLPFLFPFSSFSLLFFCLFPTVAAESSLFRLRTFVFLKGFPLPLISCEPLAVSETLQAPHPTALIYSGCNSIMFLKHTHTHTAGHLAEVLTLLWTSRRAGAPLRRTPLHTREPTLLQ